MIRPGPSISASILSADFLRLAEDMDAMTRAGIDSWHLDVMDGHFVPNLSYGLPVIKAIASNTDLELDAHLMIDNPSEFIQDYIDSGVTRLLVQVESYETQPFAEVPPRTASWRASDIKVQALLDDLQLMKDNGVDAGITINPDTPINAIPDSVYERADSILIMSVHPGFSGQKFIPSALDKIRELKTFFQGPILIDGGIAADTVKDAYDAGADILISGSYLFGADDYKSAIQTLRNI